MMSKASSGLQSMKRSRKSDSEAMTQRYQTAMPLNSRTQHSAVSRDLWEPILSTLGFEVLEVGRSSIFTPVDTETDEAVKALHKLFDASKVSNLFAVVSSDGDADRPFLCDEKLQMVRGDSIGILSSAFLKADCVVTPVSTSVMVDLATEKGLGAY